MAHHNGRNTCSRASWASFGGRGGSSETLHLFGFKLCHQKARFEKMPSTGKLSLSLVRPPCSACRPSGGPAFSELCVKHALAAARRSRQARTWKSSQTCLSRIPASAPAALTDAAVGQVGPGVGKPLPDSEVQHASTIQCCSTTLKLSSCSRMPRSCVRLSPRPRRHHCTRYISLILPPHSIPWTTPSAGSCRAAWNMPTRLMKQPAPTRPLQTRAGISV